MLHRLKHHKGNGILAALRRTLILCLTMSLGVGPSASLAQTINFFNMPQPGTMVPLSPGFTPALLQGVIVHPADPFRLDFIVDKGDSRLTGAELEAEVTKLVKYFLAALTTPEEDMWVNLSPYEGERIVPESFGVTEMGRDLLAQDYLLKQLTASLMYPDDKTGDAFWQNVYHKARQKFGTTQLPFNTFNKVWILPKSAYIFEQDNKALLLDSQLKIMLDRDYTAQAAGQDAPPFGMTGRPAEETEELTAMTSDVVRELLIPEIEREVNQGENFANLRQIYASMVLAHWYKERVKNSVLAQVYADQNKVTGVDVADKTDKDTIYAQYLEAFKKGTYNFIKEELDPVSQEIIPRKYYSGGFSTHDPSATGAGGLLEAVKTIQGDPDNVPLKFKPKLNPKSPNIEKFSYALPPIPASFTPITEAELNALVDQLDDTGEHNQAHTADVGLKKLNDPRSIPMLLGKLENSQNHMTRIRIMDILTRVGKDDDRVLNKMIDLLGHRENGVQSAAIRSLGILRDARAVPALLSGLDSTDGVIKYLTFQALGAIGGELATERLFEIAQTKDSRYKVYQAIKSLVRIFAQSLTQPGFEPGTDDYDQFVNIFKNGFASKDKSSKKVAAVGLMLTRDADLVTPKVLTYLKKQEEFVLLTESLADIGDATYLDNIFEPAVNNVHSGVNYLNLVNKIQDVGFVEPEFFVLLTQQILHWMGLKHYVGNGQKTLAYGKMGMLLVDHLWFVRLHEEDGHYRDNEILKIVGKNIMSFYRAFAAEKNERLSQDDQIALDSFLKLMLKMLIDPRLHVNKEYMKPTNPDLLAITEINPKDYLIGDEKSPGILADLVPAMSAVEVEEFINAIMNVDKNVSVTEILTRVSKIKHPQYRAAITDVQKFIRSVRTNLKANRFKGIDMWTDYEAVMQPVKDELRRRAAASSVAVDEPQAPSPPNEIKILFKSESPEALRNALYSEEISGYAVDLIAVRGHDIVGGMRYSVERNGELGRYIRASDIWVKDENDRPEVLRLVWKKMKTETDRKGIDRIEIFPVVQDSASYRLWKDLLNSLRNNEIKSYGENVDGNTLGFIIYPNKFANGEEEPFSSSQVIQESMKTWIKQLNHESPRRRGEALEELQAFSHPDVEAALFQAWKDENIEELLNKLFLSLVNRKSPLIVPILREKLSQDKLNQYDDYSDLQTSAEGLFSILGDEAIPDIAQLLESPYLERPYDDDWTPIQTLAVYILQKTKSARAGQVLLEKMRTTPRNDPFYTRIVTAVGILKVPEAHEELIDVLLHMDEVRATFQDKESAEFFIKLIRNVVIALEEIGDPRAVPVLLELAQKEWAEEDRLIQFHIIQTLAELKSPELVPVLRRIINNPQENPARLQKEALVAAIYLGTQNVPGGRQLLVEILDLNDAHGLLEKILYGVEVEIAEKLRHRLPGAPLDTLKPRLQQEGQQLAAGIRRILENLPDESLDPPQATPPGGIDFNPRWLEMEIRRDGNGMPLPVEAQPIEQFRLQIQGVVPVILDIQPVTNLPMLLGIAIPESPEDQQDTDLSREMRARDPRELASLVE